MGCFLLGEGEINLVGFMKQQELRALAASSRPLSGISTPLPIQQDCTGPQR